MTLTPYSTYTLTPFVLLLHTSKSMIDILPILLLEFLLPLVTCVGLLMITVIHLLSLASQTRYWKLSCHCDLQLASIITTSKQHNVEMLSIIIIRFNYSDGTHFGRSVSIWYSSKKSVNCVSTFKKVH